MNDLSTAATEPQTPKPIPSLALYILITLFFIGLAVSLFILFVVHNSVFLLSLLLFFLLIFAFLFWNILSYRRRTSLLLFLNSFPDSDLSFARHGQLVKITGPVSCGLLSLESSYEKASRCVYTSTFLYEYRGFCSKSAKLCKPWHLAFGERFCTDFHITDSKSGISAIVKAGSGSKVIPLLIETRIINTKGKSRILSSNLKQWLGDRNLSTEARILRLEEGYVKEGSTITVMGMLHRNEDNLMISQPPDFMCTGCLWHSFLLPVDFDGLILGGPIIDRQTTNTRSV